MNDAQRNQLLVGDVRKWLGELPDHSVDCVITSPPYYQLRDFGVGGQLGLEATVAEWVEELRLILNGLTRVLKPTGSLWLNLGDSYSRHKRFGAARKSLFLAPDRLLLALAADGWIVRNKCIWFKTNPMPHSVSDRLSSSYDVVYFLTRSPRYFFDLDAIRVPQRSRANARRGGGTRGLGVQRERGELGYQLGKNPGDVWAVSAANFRGAHFATFPLALVERPLLAACPELICDHCHTPYQRASHVQRQEIGRDRAERRREPRVRHYSRRYRVIRSRGPLRPACNCGASARPGVVLDPFLGAGTVAVAAERHGRDWVGIEINPEYARIARERLAAERARRADGPPVDGTEVLSAVKAINLSERRVSP